MELIALAAQDTYLDKSRDKSGYGFCDWLSSYYNNNKNKSSLRGDNKSLLYGTNNSSSSSYGYDIYGSVNDLSKLRKSVRKGNRDGMIKYIGPIHSKDCLRNYKEAIRYALSLNKYYPIYFLISDKFGSAIHKLKISKEFHSVFKPVFDSAVKKNENYIVQKLVSLEFVPYDDSIGAVFESKYKTNIIDFLADHIEDSIKTSSKKSNELYQLWIKSFYNSGKFEIAIDLMNHFGCTDDNIKKSFMKINNNRNNFVTNMMNYKKDITIIFEN